VELLARFSYFQILDLLITVMFLSVGLKEGNPIVNLALQSAAHPWQGLVLVKAIAFVIAFYCWQIGRYTLLVRANRFFACMVAWNVIALAISSAQWS
jgi:Domain of unknown function (DUF5658)